MAIDQLHRAERPGWLSVSPLSAGPSLVVVVSGEADWDTAPQLREKLVATLAYGPRSMVLDLTELTFCNLEGMRTLLEVVDGAQRAGVAVAMRGMSWPVSRLQHTLREHHRTGGLRGRPWAETPGMRFPPRRGGSSSAG